MAIPKSKNDNGDRGGERSSLLVHLAILNGYWVMTDNL